jgi:glycosyltransferase involved in cell wall biosynthesis
MTRRFGNVILIANPSPDIYGSDLQMLESVSALIEQGWVVIVAMPRDGTLGGMLRARGAEVRIVDFPVLRRANASPKEFAVMVGRGVRSIWTIRRALLDIRPSAVYVNTVTLPWWLLSTRLSRIPCVCHVHEAETKDRRLVRIALNAPLVLANALIVISQSSLTATCELAPYLRKRTHLIYNGVPEPPHVPQPVVIEPDEPTRLAVVGRLSPRKAPHLALETLARLRSQDRDVVLEVCGTPFAGYEWYDDELHARALEPDLAGAVTFLGYVSPIWPVLSRAHIVLAPSLREPFGNAVVEAQLSDRPVVATAALGHLETISDGVTGLLVPAEDVTAFSRAVERLIDDPEFARKVAETGRTQAIARFSVARYRSEIVALLTSIIDDAGKGPWWRRKSRHTAGAEN